MFDPGPSSLLCEGVYWPRLWGGLAAQQPEAGLRGLIWRAGSDGLDELTEPSYSHFTDDATAESYRPSGDGGGGEVTSIADVGESWLPCCCDTAFTVKGMGALCVNRADGWSATNTRVSGRWAIRSMTVANHDAVVLLELELELLPFPIRQRLLLPSFASVPQVYPE